MKMHFSAFLLLGLVRIWARELSQGTDELDANRKDKEMLVSRIPYLFQQDYDRRLKAKRVKSKGKSKAQKTEPEKQNISGTVKGSSEIMKLSHNVTVHPTIMSTAPMNNGNKNFLQPSEEIIGGTSSFPGKYPFYASTSAANSYVCGASLVAPDMLITAAHCSVAFQKGEQVLVNVSQVQTDNAGVFLSTVVQQMIHPNFVSFQHDDVMLLQIKPAITTIAPISINMDVNLPSMQENLTAIGFGKTSDTGGLAYVLQQAEVNEISTAECRTYFGNIIDSSTHICVWHQLPLRSTCDGDSGGPLLGIADSKSKTVTRSFGVLSFGAHVCTDGPSVFTRLSGYASWLSNTICTISESPPSYLNCATTNSKRTNSSSIIGVKHGQKMGLGGGNNVAATNAQTGTGDSSRNKNGTNGRSVPGRKNGGSSTHNKAGSGGGRSGKNKVMGGGTRGNGTAKMGGRNKSTDAGGSRAGQGSSRSKHKRKKMKRTGFAGSSSTKKSGNGASGGSGGTKSGGDGRGKGGSSNGRCEAAQSSFEKCVASTLTKTQLVPCIMCVDKALPAKPSSCADFQASVCAATSTCGCSKCGSLIANWIKCASNCGSAIPSCSSQTMKIKPKRKSSAICQEVNGACSKNKDCCGKINCVNQKCQGMRSTRRRRAMAGLWQSYKPRPQLPVLD